MIKRLVCISAVIILASSCLTGAESNPYSFDNLNWLVGHWQGEAFGGTIEEVWSPASGGSMVGWFKLVIDGEVSFYELMTITSDSTGYNMNLKHFNNDLTGWEEKNNVISFPYVSSSENRITFDGIDYQLQPDESLKITVDLKSDEKEHQVIIRCVKVR